MRLAFISYEYPPDTAFGGIATYVRQVTQMLLERGHSVTVITASPHKDQIQTEDRLAVHRLKGRRLRFPFRALTRFTELHGARAFDLAEVPEHYADGLLIQRRFPELPVVVRLHNPSLLQYRSNCHPQFPRPLVQRLRKEVQYSCLNVLERASTRRAAQVLAMNADMQEYVRTQWGCASTCIPNPYQPNSKLLDIPADTNTRVIGFMGRLETRKGLHTWVQALPHVLLALPDWKVRFIGEDKEGFHKQLQEAAGPFIRRLELHHPVPLEHVPRELSQMDIVAYPSLWENYPGVCLEAMSAARGIIGSQEGGMADMLADNAGYLINPHDHKAFIKALIWMAMERKDRIAMGKQARERIQTTLSATRILTQIEASYTEASYTTSG